MKRMSNNNSVSCALDHFSPSPKRKIRFKGVAWKSQVKILKQGEKKIMLLTYKVFTPFCIYNIKHLHFFPECFLFYEKYIFVSTQFTRSHINEPLHKFTTFRSIEHTLSSPRPIRNTPKHQMLMQLVPVNWDIYDAKAGLVGSTFIGRSQLKVSTSTFSAPVQTVASDWF